MLKVVHVKWEDPAFGRVGWMDRGEFDDWAKTGIARSDSVGILVYEDDKMIVLAQSLGENQTIAGGLKINRGSIKRIKKLGQLPTTLKERD